MNKSLKIVIRDQDIDDINIWQMKLELENINQLKYIYFDFSSNKITEIGVIKISEIINNQSKLESLNLYLWNNEITSIGFDWLMFSLTPLTHLKFLSIGVGNNNNICDFDAANYCPLPYLKKMKLSMFNNNISNKGSENIGIFISSLKSLTHLTLDIGHNKLCNNKIYNFCKGIQSLTNLSLLKIYFTNNVINIEHNHICTMLLNLPNLEQLYLYFDENNTIYDKFAEMIGKCIMELPKLNKIHISFLTTKVSNAAKIDLESKFSSKFDYNSFDVY